MGNNPSMSAGLDNASLMQIENCLWRRLTLNLLASWQMLSWCVVWWWSCAVNGFSHTDKRGPPSWTPTTTPHIPSSTTTNEDENLSSFAADQSIMKSWNGIARPVIWMCFWIYHLGYAWIAKHCPHFGLFNSWDDRLSESFITAISSWKEVFAGSGKG